MAFSKPFLWLLLMVAVGATMQCNALEQAAVCELFSYKIEPMMFNWTHQVISEQFRYRASLTGYADLPTWMRYEYSKEYPNVGFLYGTPPEDYAGKTVHLDIVALNKQNYETREIVLSIYVSEKFPTPNVIQMKIDNLNWVHLMDPGRVENLRNIFRKDLWPESENDLSLIFMESAVKMGGRMPLRPKESEGVIVHLGSFAQFSPRLRELQEEVRPLYKLPTCTYKRTSVQKIFENAGFKLDWCAFKMIGVDLSPEILFHNHAHGSRPSPAHISDRLRKDSWQSIARNEVPSRNYIDEFAFAFGIPGMIFALLLGILLVVLCFQHNTLFDPQSEFFFQSLFYLCEECIQNNEKSGSEADLHYDNISSKVQMVHCNDNNRSSQATTTTALKSLKGPNTLLDNVSMGSQSSNMPGDSPSAYQRPKPPPYKGGTLGRNGVDI